MTTPLPTPTPSRFTPEQSEILGQVYTLILSWRWERLRLKNNPMHTTSDMTHPTNPSPSQSGGVHE
jgi:hypothetical protein